MNEQTSELGDLTMRLARAERRAKIGLGLGLTATALSVALAACLGCLIFLPSTVSWGTLHLEAVELEAGDLGVLASLRARTSEPKPGDDVAQRGWGELVLRVGEHDGLTLTGRRLVLAGDGEIRGILTWDDDGELRLVLQGPGRSAAELTPAGLTLKGADGVDRLRLRLADGEPTLEFLDEIGRARVRWTGDGREARRP